MYPFFIIYAIVDHYRKHITIKIIQAIQSKESTTGYTTCRDAAIVVTYDMS